MRDTGPEDLTALVGSRICHDLISPLGAICNGLELMQMSGVPDSPEMALISESIENANARIRFFRVAFGAADRTQMIKSSELQAALKSSFHGRSLVVDWIPNDMPRTDAKLAFLALQCLEAALPYGGRITVSHGVGGICLEASAERIAVEPHLWERLTDPGQADCLRPAQVQFGLLADLVRAEGRALQVEPSATSIRMTAGPT